MAREYYLLVRLKYLHRTFQHSVSKVSVNELKYLTEELGICRVAITALLQRTYRCTTDIPESPKVSFRLTLTGLPSWSL